MLEAETRREGLESYFKSRLQAAIDQLPDERRRATADRALDVLMADNELKTALGIKVSGVPKTVRQSHVRSRY